MQLCAISYLNLKKNCGELFTSTNGQRGGGYLCRYCHHSCNNFTVKYAQNALVKEFRYVTFPAELIYANATTVML